MKAEVSAGTLHVWYRIESEKFSGIISIAIPGNSFFLIGFPHESFVINITESCNNISIFRRWFYIHYSGYYK